MGGLINEGTAHNHPPVCTIPPISSQSKSLRGCWVGAQLGSVVEWELKGKGSVVVVWCFNLTN